jgi:hypothetical protein
MHIPFPFYMIRAGCLWCLVWTLVMLYISAVVPAFAFYGMMSAIALSGGGVWIGFNELGEDWF